MASWAPANPGPSEDPEARLRDLPEVIRDRLRRMRDAFLQYYRDNGGKQTAESALSCYTEAQDLYWRIMESHVRQEKERLDTADISESGPEAPGFLQQELYHCSLMACSLGIVIALQNFPCDFVLLLELIKLPPYCFFKIIDPVLRADGELSKSVVAHLCEVEIQIVLSAAWASDSPLWEDLKTNGGCMPLCQQVMPSSQLEELKVNVVSVDHSYSVQQYSSSAIGSPPKTMQLFARKVYLLMGNHLRKLCRVLQISNDLRLKIWTCFEHSLVHTDLMMDRHLDQLLLCAIYIIAKFNNVEISFKHMMKNYYRQPLANKNVCKSVLISREDGENQSHGSYSLTPNTPTTHHPGKETRKDLIYFYNHVYVTKMEAFAQQFEPVPGVETPTLSPYPRQRIDPSHKQRLSSRHSIYIYPYDADTRPLYNRSISYTFKSNSRESLKEINNLLKRCTQQNEVDEDEALFKIPRMRNSTFLQEQVKNVMNDRMTAMDQN